MNNMSNYLKDNIMRIITFIVLALLQTQAHAQQGEAIIFGDSNIAKENANDFKESTVDDVLKAQEEFTANFCKICACCSQSNKEINWEKASDSILESTGVSIVPITQVNILKEALSSSNSNIASTEYAFDILESRIQFCDICDCCDNSYGFDVSKAKESGFVSHFSSTYDLDQPDSKETSTVIVPEWFVLRGFGNLMK